MAGWEKGEGECFPKGKEGGVQGRFLAVHKRGHVCMYIMSLQRSLGCVCFMWRQTAEFIFTQLLEGGGVRVLGVGTLSPLSFVCLRVGVFAADDCKVTAVSMWGSAARQEMRDRVV